MVWSDSFADFFDDILEIPSESKAELDDAGHSQTFLALDSMSA